MSFFFRRRSKTALFALAASLCAIFSFNPAFSQTNHALSATASHSSGGTSATGYGPELYNNGSYGVCSITGTYQWGWVNNGAYIDFIWSSNVTFDKVKFYKANRPMGSCTFQYWNGSAYVSFYTYSNTTACDHEVSFSPVTTTRLRLLNIQPVSGFSSPNFREIEVLGSACSNPITGTTSIAVGSTTTLTTGFTNTSTISYSGSSPIYATQQFSSSGTFTTALALTVDALVVAGGGGGAGRHGGGGGGGGVRYVTSLAVPANTYSVTVGSGGAAGTGTCSDAASNRGGSGGNSIFHTITAIGGGGGATYHLAALSGGSGGGGAGAMNTSGAVGTAGQGNAGGNGGGNPSGGGGGGAAAAGSSANVNGGNGGAGVLNTITGSNVYYGGGGGGGGDASTTGGTGGIGGGGHGGDNGVQTNQTAGIANTGGGGGGCRSSNCESGSAGGSGIVILKYPAGVWSSSNTSVATVNANSGLVTAISPGFTVISYTSTSGCAESVVFSVTPQAVCQGTNITMSAPMPTGGSVSAVGTDRVHRFTSGGSFYTPLDIGSARVLVVAGGGGGGSNGGGGGGAGGLIHNTAYGISSGSTSVTVGSGGGSSATSFVTGSSGGNSVFGTLTATGGGGGASRDGGGGGLTGGSGGGGGGGQTAAGSATAGQGFAGRTGYDNGCNSTGGGGGGAGGLGTVGASNLAGNGGIGLSNDITGTVTYYAGGGGGGTTGFVGCGGNNSWSGTNGTGGNGGGGNGESTAGTANTGGGGGAERAGGSGVVIVRYAAGSWSTSNASVATIGSVDVVNGTATISTVGAGTATITYTSINGSGYSIPVTVNSLSVAPTGINGVTTVCNGSSTSLTVSGGSQGTGANVQWFSASCGGTSAGTGTSISVSPTTNTTYYVRYSGTCNTTSCASTTVNVNQLSTAPDSISGPSSVCLGNSVTLNTAGGTLGTNAVDVWYSGSCTEVFDESWDSQSYGLGATTVNSVNNGVLNLTSTSNDPMIFMSALGSFDPNVYRYVNIRYRVLSGTAGNVEIFFYNTTHNFAVGGETGFGSLVSDGNWHVLSVDMHADPDYLTGGNIVGWRYDWATASGVTMELDFISLGQGPLIESGSSLTVSPTSTTTYYSKKKGTCNSTSCVSKQIQINQASVAPTSISGVSSLCSGNSTSLSVSGGSLGTGASAQWFTGSCGGTSAGTGNSISVSPTSTTTYYVRYAGTCNTTSCTSTTITVNPAPTAFSPTVVTTTPLCMRSKAEIQVANAESGISYQLRENATNIGSSQTGNGATLSFLTNDLSATNANYNVLATASGGCTLSAAVPSISVDLPANGYASDNETRVCYVNGSEFVEFRSSAGVMLSINPNGQNLGNVSVTEYAGSPVSIQACNTYQPWYVTAALGRHWAIEPEFQPSSAVAVRLYYDNSDYTSLQAVANINANPNDNIVAQGSLDLSKYSNPNPAVINGTFSDNCNNGGSSTVHTPSGMGAINSVSGFGSFVASGMYSTYSISSFSEFWLSGTTNVSPLPIELVSFQATCADGFVRLDWVTASEINNEKFIVERSANLDTWESVLEIAGAGNSNQALSYSSVDERPLQGLSYYRLTQKDYDGASETFEPVSITCYSDEKGNSMFVYPNPATDVYNVSISSTEDVSDASIELVDMKGQSIFTQQVNLVKGDNTFTYQSIGISAGTYMIRVSGKNIQLKPILLVIK